MVKVCLDFETAVSFLRGENTTLEKLKYYADREEICVTSFTMMHLLDMVKKPEVVSAFTNGVTILPFDRKAAHIAAHIMANDLKDQVDLHKKMEGIMTAAVCIANDALLFSRSPSKFEGIKGVNKV